MAQKAITQILVGPHRVGLVGLTEAFDDLGTAWAERSDADVAQHLIARLSRENYIPDKAYDIYGPALVREFRRHLGQPVAPAETEDMTVQVFGPGCTQCERLMADVVSVLAELNLAADVVHVRDMREIAAAGVTGVPALMVGRRLIFSGGSPPRSRLKEALADTLEKKS